MEGKPRTRERLEIPAVAPLEQKLANFTRQRPSIGPAPRSAVLDKLSAFLPQLAQENARLTEQLQSRPPADFDIEHVDEEDAPYIEMDLACGILELRDMAALQAAERAMNGQEGGLDLGGSGSSSSGSDDDSDDDEEESDDGEGGSGALGSDSGDEDGVIAEQRVGLSSAAGPRSADPSATSDDEGGGVGSQAEDGMECDGAGADGCRGADVKVGVKQPGRGSRGRGGPKGHTGGAGTRRKVSAKRSKMIQELS